MDYQSGISYILTLWADKPRVATVILKKHNQELFDIVNKLEGSSFSEKAWKYVNNYITSVPCCEVCRLPTKFLDFRRGFSKLCSKKCTANSSNVQIKKTNTMIEKFGVEHYSKSTMYKEKFKNTCRNRYGVENPGQIKTLIQQRSRTKQLTFFNKLLHDIKEFSKPNFLFDDYTDVRDIELSWSCILCDNIFYSNLFGKLPKCPSCFPRGNFGGQSSIEKEILEEIRLFYSGTILENTREVIAPKELDLYFPDKKFAIEVNGIYWHSSPRLEPNYHQSKFNECEQAGITLLMITDHEWETKKSVILNMIKHRLSASDFNKIYAKTCRVEPISSKIGSEFLEKHHINGNSKASVYLGLFSNKNELISVLSFITRNRFKKQVNTDIEIVRLAFNGIAVGALGKFIKYIKSNLPNRTIVTYADLRYGQGLVYNKNGFVLQHTTNPGYWYFLKNKIYHRLAWTKQKLVKMGFDTNKTEYQIMINDLGALKIYDCGHRYYELQ